MRREPTERWKRKRKILVPFCLQAVPQSILKASVFFSMKSSVKPLLILMLQYYLYLGCKRRIHGHTTLPPREEIHQSVTRASKHRNPCSHNEVNLRGRVLAPSRGCTKYKCIVPPCAMPQGNTAHWQMWSCSAAISAISCCWTTR